MWIVPRNSRFSHCVQDTEVSNSDWPEHWKTLLESLGMCFAASGENERDWNEHVRIDYEMILCMERSEAGL